MSDDKTNKPLLTFEKKTKKRGRGRPAKIPLVPASDVVAQIQKNKEKFLEKDILTNQMQNDPDSLDVLDLLMKELAIEAASLEFERNESERTGTETSTISSKKVTAIKSIADIYFRKRDTVLNESFDFKSKRFQKLFQFFLMKVREAAKDSGMNDELINIFFNNIAQVFEDWEREALSYIKSD